MLLLVSRIIFCQYHYIVSICRTNETAPSNRRQSGGGLSARVAGGDQRARNAPKSSGGISQKNGKLGQKGGSTGDRLKFSELAKQEGWADLELIEGVERDIVEAKLSVTWERYRIVLFDCHHRMVEKEN